MRAVFENFKSAEFRKKVMIELVGDFLCLMLGLILAYYAKIWFFL